MSIRAKIRQDILYLIKDLVKPLIDQADSPEGADFAFKLVQQCNTELEKIEHKRSGFNKNVD